MGLLIVGVLFVLIATGMPILLGDKSPENQSYWWMMAGGALGLGVLGGVISEIFRRRRK
jgi:hypothetical protein